MESIELKIMIASRVATRKLHVSEMHDLEAW